MNHVVVEVDSVVMVVKEVQQELGSFEFLVQL
jgi:hypothetical protein